MVMPANNQAAAANNAAVAAGHWCGILFVVLTGLAFTVCGYQTVTGQSSDTCGNGVGSIVIGLLVLLTVALAVGVGVQRGNNVQVASVIVGAAVLGLFGAAFVLAEVLALAGRTAYLEWKEDNAPGQKNEDETMTKMTTCRDDENQDMMMKTSGDYFFGVSFTFVTMSLSSVKVSSLVLAAFTIAASAFSSRSFSRLGFTNFTI
jgi:hypothetical protein